MDEITIPVSSGGEFHTLFQIEKLAILAALTYCGGNITQTAKTLNISRSSMYRKADQHNISLTAE